MGGLRCQAERESGAGVAMARSSSAAGRSWNFHLQLSSRFDGPLERQPAWLRAFESSFIRLSGQSEIAAAVQVGDCSACPLMTATSVADPCIGMHRVRPSDPL